MPGLGLGKGMGHITGAKSVVVGGKLGQDEKGTEKALLVIKSSRFPAFFKIDCMNNNFLFCFRRNFHFTVLNVCLLRLFFQHQIVRILSSKLDKSTKEK